MPDITGYTKAKTDSLLTERLRWGGVWDAAVQYKAGDLVRKPSDGSLWVALEDPLLGSIPASTVDPERWRMNFAADTGGLSNAGGNTLASSGGHLTVSSGDSLMAYAPFPTFAKMLDGDYVQCQFSRTSGAEVGLSLEGWQWNVGMIGGLTYTRTAMFVSTGAGQPDQHYPGGNPYADSTYTGGMPATGWLRLQRNGNDLVVSYFNVDPATNPPPVKTFTYTLPTAGGLATSYGAGTQLRAGVAMKGVGWIDDLVVATPYSGPEPSWELLKA